MQQKENEQTQAQESESTNDGGRDMLKLFTNLTYALKDTSKSDVSLPPKYYGDDDKWEGWYKQWRAYLQAKDWLSTADHQEGPGAKDFDVKINSKIYNTLIIYVRKEKLSLTSSKRLNSTATVPTNNSSSDTTASPSRSCIP